MNIDKRIEEILIKPTPWLEEQISRIYVGINPRQAKDVYLVDKQAIKSLIKEVVEEERRKFFKKFKEGHKYIVWLENDELFIADESKIKQITKVNMNIDKRIEEILRNQRDPAHVTYHDGIKPEVTELIKEVCEEEKIQLKHNLIDKMEKFERFFEEAPIDYDDRKTMWIDLLNKLLK